MITLWFVLKVAGLVLWTLAAFLVGWLVGTFGPVMAAHASAFLAQNRARDAQAAAPPPISKFAN